MALTRGDKYLSWLSPWQIFFRNFVTSVAEYGPYLKSYLTRSSFLLISLLDHQTFNNKSLGVVFVFGLGVQVVGLKLAALLIVTVLPAINGGINSHPMRIENSLLFLLENLFSVI